MTAGDFDLELLLIIPFSVGAAATLGLVETTIIPFLDLGEVFFELGTIDVTLGRILAVLSILAVIINRDESLRETGGADLWIGYATIGLVLAPPIFPILADTLAQQPAALFAFITQGLGFSMISISN